MPNYPDLENAVKKAQRQILDLLEAAMGESPQWPLIRSRILGVFGRNGLAGALQLERKSRKGEKDV